MKDINKEIINDIMNQLPAEKIEALKKAMHRNWLLTSTTDLENVTLTVYMEGFLVEFEGTRCAFRVFAKDDDGDLVIIRKPWESKLHKIYKDEGKTWRIIDLDKFISERA